MLNILVRLITESLLVAIIMEMSIFLIIANQKASFFSILLLYCHLSILMPSRSPCLQLTKLLMVKDPINKEIAKTRIRLWLLTTTRSRSLTWSFSMDNNKKRCFFKNNVSLNRKFLHNILLQPKGFMDREQNRKFARRGLLEDLANPWKVSLRAQPTKTAVIPEITESWSNL